MTSDNPTMNYNSIYVGRTEDESDECLFIGDVTYSPGREHAMNSGGTRYFIVEKVGLPERMSAREVADWALSEPEELDDALNSGASAIGETVDVQEFVRKGGA